MSCVAQSCERMLSWNWHSPSKSSSFESSEHVGYSELHGSQPAFESARYLAAAVAEHFKRGARKMLHARHTRRLVEVVALAVVQVCAVRWRWGGAEARSSAFSALSLVFSAMSDGLLRNASSG